MKIFKDIFLIIIIYINELSLVIFKLPFEHILCLVIYSLNLFNLFLKFQEEILQETIISYLPKLT